MNAWPQSLLKQIVDETAENLTDQVPELEKRLAEISAQLDLARAATARAEAFPTRGEYCPNCWLNGVQATLVKIDNGKLRADSFRCNRCRETFNFPY
jgi:hypothetical protein